jgi:hypothetical protein
MWVRLARHYDFDYVDKSLVHIRRHGANMNSDAARMYRGYLRMFAKWLSEVRNDPEIVRTWRREYTVPMLIAIVRDLRSTRLLRRTLSSEMSHELKKFAMTQIPGITFDLGKAALKKIFGR